MNNLFLTAVFFFGRLVGSRVLVRLAHIFAVDEDPVLSQPASVGLNTLFPGIVIPRNA